MSSLEIGSRLRKLRKERHMSLSVLAEKSGVSTGLISQIERELVAPSVVSLYHIAQALDTDISYFFTNSSPHYTLQRKGEHRIIITNNGLDQHEMLNPVRSDRTFDLLRLTLKGGETYDRECIAHQGEECCYVLSGVLTVLIDDEELTLFPGDSLYFSSSHPHLYLNCGEEECVSIWAIAPKFF
jgi:transcriptional regulator with XRE-family HTH domain